MYTTFYISSDGQPRNNVQRHARLAHALAAWRKDRAALLAASWGRAVLERDNSLMQLLWVEAANGGYVTGDLAYLVEGNDE